MGQFNKMIEHVDGCHDVEIDIEGDQAVIHFGASFTLRLEEHQLSSLCDMIQHALGAVREARRRAHFWAVDAEVNKEADEISMSDLEAADEVMQSLELEMVQAGIDGREKRKEMNRAESTSEAIQWNPNDPANW